MARERGDGSGRETGARFLEEGRREEEIVD